MKTMEFGGMKVTVMGLGLNGGGLATVRFLAERGALVTATDLRNADVLAPSLARLKDLEVRYVLGEHRMEDFENADMVIKNPAVPASSPYLKAAKRVETDLSLFLTLCDNPILAVTGSKGKSSVVSALHHIMRGAFPGCRLGGNITRSPLSFLTELKPEDPVVLELSSWQLGDLRGRDLLHPEIAVLTNIMNDHQNMYDDFEDYVDDKREIYRGQKAGQKAIFLLDERGRDFASECPGESLFYSPSPSPESAVYMDGDRGFFRPVPRTGAAGAEAASSAPGAPGSPAAEELLPAELKTPGRHFRLNCLIAAAAARLYGLDGEVIKEGLADFPGVPHRLELINTSGGVRYYNDTTATIPEAMAAGIESFDAPVHLICGGNDKELDYGPAADALRKPAGIYLLEGTASEKIAHVLEKTGKGYEGPFASLEKAFAAARSRASADEVVLLSPGATSFGMFINEFHRGDSFRELAAALPADALNEL
jgi:UDP-N-acetylmuramoylalanine--D-glutamate ligase